MDSIQFDFSMERIARVFGEKNYPIDRRVLLYEQLKGYDPGVFQKACDSLIAGNRYAPMQKDFVEALEQCKGFVQVSNRIGDCVKCQGYGSYFTTENTLDYGWQCSCEAGSRLAGGLPRRR